MGECGGIYGEDGEEREVSHGHQSFKLIGGDFAS